MLLISGGHKANGCGDIRPLSPTYGCDGPRCKGLTGVFVSAGRFRQAETVASKSAIRSRLIWYGEVSDGLWPAR